MANEVCKQCHKSVYYKCERIYGADTPPCAKAVVENCHSLQQLKAEILPLVHISIGRLREGNIDDAIDFLNEVSAKLSAV